MVTLRAIAGLMAVAWLFGQPSAQGRSPFDLLPDTSDRLVPFADQLGNNYSDRVVRFVATRFAGTQKLLRSENDRYRAIDPRWLLLHYRLGISSGPVPYIHDNRWSSDWREVTAHEDWFLHNARGQRHNHPGNRWDIHDITNPGFREYWLSNVIADMRATGAQGVFADSFEAGVSSYGITPPDPRFAGMSPADPLKWPDGVTWLDQKRSLVAHVVDRFAATPEQFLFVPNIGGLTTTWWWPEYERVPGAMLENFALNVTPEDWVLSMNRALSLTSAGKLIIVESYPTSVQERLFLVGSYLMLKGQHTFINAGGGGALYFPEYDLPLGPSREPLPRDVAAYAWQGVYRRDFRDATVIVNPSEQAVSVDVPEEMRVVTPEGGGQLRDADVDRDGRYVGGRLQLNTSAPAIVLPPRSAQLLARGQR